MTRVTIVEIEGCMASSAAITHDVMATANQISGTSKRALPFGVTTIRCGPRRNSGKLRGTDLVIVPGLGTASVDRLEEKLGGPACRRAGDLLVEAFEAGAALAASCASTFLLGETGLLDGRRATTTWWLAPFFRQLYPQVQLDESRMLVPTGQVVTAGAALAHLDLALWILRQHSPSLANLVAHYLMIDERPSQAAYVISDHLAHADPLIERFERWARARLAKGFSLTEAARSVGASERTLARHLHRVLGKTPLSYFQDLRIEHAVHRLQTGTASVDSIASEVGYADGVTLRTLLRRKLGRGVRELRGRG